MDVQQELEALYQKALDLKSRGQVSEADALDSKAASLLHQLKSQIEAEPNSPATATVLLYLAERDWAILGDHEEVHDQIKRALEIRQKNYGIDHVLTAEALAKWAEVHFLAGRFGDAEALYKQAIPIFEEHGKDSDPVCAKALEGLAQTLAALNRPQEADAYFVRAIDSAGSDDQGKRTLYFLLIYRAEGLEKLSRTAEAEALRQKAATLLPKANPGEFGFQA